MADGCSGLTHHRCAWLRLCARGIRTQGSSFGRPPPAATLRVVPDFECLLRLAPPRFHGEWIATGSGDRLRLLTHSTWRRPMLIDHPYIEPTAIRTQFGAIFVPDPGRERENVEAQRAGRRCRWALEALFGAEEESACSN